MVVYRVTNLKHARDLSGEGARTSGGRWNSPGYPMLYTSTSRSLSLLEMLAHSTVLPLAMVRVTLEIPARTRIQKIELADLPMGWNSRPHTSVSQKIGDTFLIRKDSLALQVPSVIVKEESNILINPLYPSSQLIKILNIESLDIDSRLK
jgi:RES domain-containing protein